MEVDSREPKKHTLDGGPDPPNGKEHFYGEITPLGQRTHLFFAPAGRYDTRSYFNVRSKADISQLNLPHGTNN